jgi:hypothetical protein
MSRALDISLGLILILTLLVTGCGAKSENKSASDLAAILRAHGHDVKAEAITIEQSYADSERSPEDKGTTYVVRVGQAEKKVEIGPVEIKVADRPRYKIFIADSDGWTKLK